ncbi:hypothetical protein V1264_006240 [Littorina saxatilis]|uniref:Uncharacterized protein n=1 Tax=Littorina saxatilis TaxID=31220 RepID=A0AAN9G5J3_9CAEN
MAQQLVSNCGDQTQSECADVNEADSQRSHGSVCCCGGTLTGQALGAYCECIAGKDSPATMWPPPFLLLHTTWLKESTLCQQTKLVHTTNVCGRGMLP